MGWWGLRTSGGPSRGKAAGPTSSALPGFESVLDLDSWSSIPFTGLPVPVASTERTGQKKWVYSSDPLLEPVVQVASWNSTQIVYDQFHHYGVQGSNVVVTTEAPSNAVLLTFSLTYGAW